VELWQYNLTFETQRAIKAHAMAVFLAEGTNTTADSGSMPLS